MSDRIQKEIERWRSELDALREEERKKSLADIRAKFPPWWWDDVENRDFGERVEFLYNHHIVRIYETGGEFHVSVYAVVHRFELAAQDEDIVGVRHQSRAIGPLELYDYVLSCLQMINETVNNLPKSKKWWKENNEST